MPSAAMVPCSAACQSVRAFFRSELDCSSGITGARAEALQLLQLQHGGGGAAFRGRRPQRSLTKLETPTTCSPCSAEAAPAARPPPRVGRVAGTRSVWIKRYQVRGAQLVALACQAH